MANGHLLKKVPVGRRAPAAPPDGGAPDNPWRDPDDGLLAALIPSLWPAVAAELVVAALLIGLIVADGRAP